MEKPPAGRYVFTAIMGELQTVKEKSTLSKAHKKIFSQAMRAFKDIRILVLGDLIIDHFIWGSVSRISPEAPVPVVNVTHDNLLLGGSANVVGNIYALGGQAAICGLVGKDDMGCRLLALLDSLQSNSAGVVQSDQRPTTIKTRIIAQSQQVVRFDREDSAPVTGIELAGIKQFIQDNIGAYNAVIVSDYNKGIITPDVMAHLCACLAGYPDIPLIIDPKPDQPARFKGATIITPNHHEAEQLTGIKITDDDSLRAAGLKLLAELGSEAVLITRGEAGMGLVEKDGRTITIPTVAREVFDVTGAGDTVIAALALGLAAQLSYADAAALANYAAGIVVGKVGTATASQAELLEVMQ
jgi:D-beta-D-heptose 7-phosphate kinase/D-beta-D-heptose 1-phosphate adenosyltransferase